MNLGEKIYKLRKEKGLSQEALAEQINTTRQAVSKWENNQGYPETEKLILLSNVFEVSIDYLVKDNKAGTASDAKGYYVSKEMAAGYIACEKRISKLCGLGFALLAFTGVPYSAFPSDSGLRILGMAICIVIGVSFFAMALFSENDAYDVLKKEPLLFDYAHLKELSAEYSSMKRKYTLIAIPCSILFIAGILAAAFTENGALPWTELTSLIFLTISVGIFGLAYAAGSMEAYEILVENEKYINRFIFKLKKKMKIKFDKW